MEQLVAGRCQGKGEAPGREGSSCDTHTHEYLRGVTLSHLELPSLYLAEPLCHLISSRAWCVVAAIGEAAVIRKSCRGWALCWGCPKAQSNTASTSGGPPTACRVSMLSQMSCTVSCRERA